MSIHETALDTVVRDLAVRAPNTYTQEEIDLMTDEAWELWSVAQFDYGDSPVPTSVLKQYVQTIEEESATHHIW